MKALCSGGSSKFHMDLGITLRLCHDGSGRGSIARDAYVDVHNRFKIAATNHSSTLDPMRPMMRFRFAHDG